MNALEAKIEARRKELQARLDASKKAKTDRLQANADRLPGIMAQIEALPHADLVMARREVRALPDYLADDEPILAVGSGQYDRAIWLIMVTDRRVLLLDRGWFGVKQTDVPLGSISSVAQSLGLLLGSIKIVGSGFAMEIDAIRKETVADLARSILAARDEAAVPA
ncbi:MAG: PH domain-containing protein [Gammaproteobacteria bacterium]|nr:PH domain-containing protein [Gammaproteobacteria bacterium]MDE0414015.1 PH domain-containing protein [Gammaproteobacteria bacterium]